jgi:hypothetical protein
MYLSIRPLGAVYAEWRCPRPKGKYKWFETWSEGYERFFFIGRLHLILIPARLLKR